MSLDNVDIVRRFNERWLSGDWEGVAELVDPGIEQHGAVGGVEEGRLLRGLDAIRSDWEAVEEQWDEHRVEPQRFIDAGDRVVVLLREYHRGTRSGIELTADTAVIADLRRGLIVRVQGYTDQAAALEAVGLEQ